MVNLKSDNDNNVLSADVEAGLGYLFLTFLKIGALSFGGHMALVAVIQKIMVDEDKTVTSNDLIDGVSVASLLPGPLAVNLVAYIGYTKKRKSGALISMLGIVLPAFILMLALSWVYFAYGYKFNLAGVMQFTTGVVCAIILSTGIQLFKKEISFNPVKIALCFAAIAITLLLQGYLIIIGLIAMGALAGYFLKIDKDKTSITAVIKELPVAKKPAKNFLYRNTSGKTFFVIIAVIEVIFLTNAQQYFSNILSKLVLVFSGISINLFGGGYVVIPFMQSLFVEQLNWLQTQEFIDAIAFSQATPGPIMVSATFIGFKMAGISGAIVATICIFLPSALLMIIVAKMVLQHKNQQLIKSILAGLKPVVIGLILASAIKIMLQLHFTILLAAIIVAAFLLSYKIKLSPVYLIAAAVLMGIVSTLIN